MFQHEIEKLEVGDVVGFQYRTYMQGARYAAKLVEVVKVTKTSITAVDSEGNKTRFTKSGWKWGNSSNMFDSSRIVHRDEVAKINGHADMESACKKAVLKIKDNESTLGTAIYKIIGGRMSFVSEKKRHDAEKINSILEIAINAINALEEGDDNE